MKIAPSGLASDLDFLRRVYLDLTGLPPSANEVSSFLEDKRDSRQKRDEIIDRLIGNEQYVEYWSNKWADMLQVNGKFLGRQGAVSLRNWIEKEISKNTPYDEFAKKVLTASGSNKENPPASYYKILRTPEDTMENTTHLFLATRLIVTNAMITLSSAGRRINIMKWPPILPNLSWKKIQPPENRRSERLLSKGQSRCMKS